MVGTTTVETAESRIHRRRWWTLLVLTWTATMVAMNSMILTVALPTIQSELGSTTTELQWIVNIYTLVAGALLLTFGALSDRLGRARFFQGGLVVFCLANLGAAFSSTATQLIISRAFMGVGVALMQCCILAILTNVFPREERGKAIAVWAGLGASAFALGPIIGGSILEALDWKWIFAFNIPLSVIAFAAGWFFVPDSRDDHPPRPDLFGNALFLAGIASLIYGLNNAGSHGWTDPVVLGTILSSLVVLALFVLWEHRREDPLLDMSFFKNIHFSTSLTTITIFFFCYGAILYILTFYMQFIKDYSPLETGERYLPLAIGFLIGAIISARLVVRFGIKMMIFAGLLGASLMLLLATFFTIGTPFWRVGTVLLLLGFSLGSTVSPAMDLLMGSLPKAKSGIGSAMNNIATYVGSSIGVATLGSLLTSIYSSHFEDAAASIQGLPAALLDKASDSVGAAVSIANSGQIPSELAIPLAEAGKQSFMDGWQVVTIALCVVFAAGAAISLRFVPRRHA